MTLNASQKHRIRRAVARQLITMASDARNSMAKGKLTGTRPADFVALFDAWWDIMLTMSPNETVVMGAGLQRALDTCEQVRDTLDDPRPKLTHRQIKDRCR